MHDIAFADCQVFEMQSMMTESGLLFSQFAKMIKRTVHSKLIIHPHLDGDSGDIF